MQGGHYDAEHMVYTPAHTLVLGLTRLVSGTLLTGPAISMHPVQP